VKQEGGKDLPGKRQENRHRIRITRRLRKRGRRGEGKATIL
jgi:hypothetical protein